MIHRLATLRQLLTLGLIAALGSTLQAQVSFNFGNTSTFGTGNIPGRSASADLDGDGDRDLVVLNVLDNTATVWRNDGNLTFTNIATLNTANSPADVDLVDMDGDTILDVVITARQSTVQVFINSGSASFAAPLSSPAGFDSYSALPIDLNADGALDLLVCNYASNKISVLFNDGSGNLSLVSASFAGGGGPTKIIAADLDNDNDDDLLVELAGSNAVMLVQNTGAGLVPLTYLGTGVFPLDMIVNDFNYDGLLDIATCNVFSNDVTVILNQGGLTFAAPANYAVGDRPTGLAVLDADNGLGMDIAVATFDGGGVSVLRNDGTSAFGINSVLSTGGNIFHVLTGDFDGDWDDDILAVNLSGNAIHVLANQIPARRYPGSDEDLELVSMIDGITIPSGQAVTVGQTNSIVINTLISFMGTFDNDFGIIAMQQYNRGFPPFTNYPGLYLNNFVYPAQALLQQTLVPGGITVQFNIPMGLVGNHYLVQGIALSPNAANGMAAFTDALEFHVLP
ncbi:MAG: VCBS repeat-containing protein [Planctomycetes bacterium]|nr:VCBS repeat-containing protein [Planctomycetota bacterium]